MKPLTLAFWIILVIAPFAISLAFFAAAPDVVAMHFGFNGQVDRYGSRFELLITGGFMSTCNALFFLFYAFSDKLHAYGFIKTKTPQSGRVALVIVAVLFIIVTILLLALSLAFAP
ncbi:DUF1648 domain-containing protein [uncultured Slackia sp.]|uniref:DUF1648 domain-containing protein n=1 Tax=uncultured Slackia sp. TaxID=665903 RepID=UPI0025CEA944|nr:DUF1648 domain-containing protein [uncultured Slackia sp.]